MLSYAEVFYEGARSYCYPPARSSRIKVSPFKETRKRGKADQVTDATSEPLEFTAVSGGQERQRQDRGRREGSKHPRTTRTPGVTRPLRRRSRPPDGLRALLAGRLGVPLFLPWIKSEANRGSDPPFLTRRPTHLTPALTAPVPPTATCAGLTAVTLLQEMAKDSFPPRKQR